MLRNVWGSAGVADESRAEISWPWDVPSRPTYTRLLIWNILSNHQHITEHEYLYFIIYAYLWVCCHPSDLTVTYHRFVFCVLFLFVIHSVVDMLWDYTARHLLRQPFLCQASSLYSSSPIATPPQGHSVCRQDNFDGFWAEVFCDSWFNFLQL